MKKRFEFIFIFLIISVSGIPVISDYNDIFYIIILLIGSLFVVTLKTDKFNISSSLSKFMIIFFIYFAIQTIRLPHIEISAVLGSIIRLIMGFFCAVFITNFHLKYLKIVKLIIILSTPFYLVSLFYPNIMDFAPVTTELGHKSFLFYNFNINHVYDFRNTGPFWEPTAYAIFLIFALIFQYYKDNNNFIYKNNLLFILSLISTLSTTGFIAATIFYLYIVSSKKQEFFIRFLKLMMLIVIAAYTYFNAPVLDAKIKTQINDVEKVDDRFNNSRFSVMLIDFERFLDYPYWGTGYSKKNRFKRYVEGTGNATNGLTDLLVAYGVIGSLLILIMLYRNFRLFFNSGRVAIFVVVLTLIISFSEQFFNKSIFWCFFMFYLSNQNKNYIRCTQ